MFYDYDSCPTEFKKQIDLVVDMCKKYLSKNLVGVYLHGSLAMGCFNPGKSDIDLLVVVREKMLLKIKIDIVKALMDISSHYSQLEISFLLEDKIKEAIFPLHYDFHFSEYWREKFEHCIDDLKNKIWENDNLTDIDLSAHIRVLVERGLTIFGEDKSIIFPKVNDDEYLQAILLDFEDAYEGVYKNPEYYILNTCRILYFLESRCVSSKKEAGEWYVESVNDKYIQLVKMALNVYTGKVSSTGFNNNSLRKFIKEKENKITEKIG